MTITDFLNVISDSENFLGLRELQPEQISHWLSFKTLGKVFWRDFVEGTEI